MSIAMPLPDAEVLAGRDGFLAALSRIVPGEGVIADEKGLRTYECDGLAAYRALPLAVVLPETVEQVAAMPERAQELLGFDVYDGTGRGNGVLGYYEMGNPKDLFRT